MLHSQFVQEQFKFTILNSVIVTRSSDLMELVNSEARVMLLYCTKEEAVDILASAEELKITGKSIVVSRRHSSTSLNKRKIIKISIECRRKLCLGGHSKCD